MSFQRKLVGEPTEYKGYIITVRYMGPDLLGYVNNEELSGFFVDVRAVVAAGARYVDQKLKEAK